MGVALDVDNSIDASEKMQSGLHLVLLVEDELTLVASLSYYLRSNGFNVTTAHDGVTAVHAARSEHPDVIVLDLMLPGMDGLEVCRRVRADSDVPILMLTARSEEMDRVVGLEVGADDYMTKPFSMRELAARLRALLRRSGRHGGADRPAPVVVGAIQIDPRGRTVHLRGVELALKPKAFDLLLFLARNPDQVFTRGQLLERVWGYEFDGGSRTVDVHMRWLREKVEDDPAAPRHLLTARGVGYKLVR
jgi:two-component system alkaline phosphatase synthesis response regulator PhoP